MMLSSCVYRRLVLLSLCVVANLLVGFYAFTTLLKLTGLSGYDTDQQFDDGQPRQSTNPVDSAVTLRTGGEDRSGRRWSYDELMYGVVLEPPGAAEGRYCGRLSPANQVHSSRKSVKKSKKT